jgi:hypothetical protein
MRRLICCLDIMTACTLTFTGWYMYTAFSDLFSQAVCLSCLVAMTVMGLIPLGNTLVRHKRRIVNMIEEPIGEFTS